MKSTIAKIGVGLSRQIAKRDLGKHDLCDLAQAWRAIEDQTGVGLRLHRSDDDLEDRSITADLLYGRLFPFLDQTGLVLTGEDLQMRFELTIDGHDYLFSWREWGGYMAEWMQRNNAIGNFWDYLTFYMDHYLNDALEDYPCYRANLEKVIQIKCGLETRRNESGGLS